MSQSEPMTAHKNNKTLYLFITAQTVVVGSFLFVLLASLLRLNDTRLVLDEISSSSIPALSQATSITRDVQHLISLTSRLTTSENNASRLIIKNRIDDTIKGLDTTKLKLDQGGRYLATQLSVLMLEIEELNELVELRINTEKEVNTNQALLFAYFNDFFAHTVFKGENAKYAQLTVPLLLQIAQINQQVKLFRLRQLESSIERNIALLKTQPFFDDNHRQFITTMREIVLGSDGMVEKQASAMRIRGRSIGRGSFVEHLAEDIASSIEFKATLVTEETYDHAITANRHVTNQVWLSLGLSIIALFVCCAIIWFIYKKIILRLITLTTLVERGSHKLDTFKGQDEISRLASTFAMYMEKVEAQEKRLIQLSLSDPLTGIPNRRAFEREAEKGIALAKRQTWPLTLVLLDVDNFKLYNDYYGHTQGDSCLKSVAKKLKSVVSRDTDFCARYGGEEFVVLLQNTNAEGAKVKAEEIRQAIESLGLAHSKSDVSPFVTASLGAATFFLEHYDNVSLSSLLDCADEALYHAKRSGRNRCSYSVSSIPKA